jgi:SAM-dependent methyltransferase
MKKGSAWSDASAYETFMGRWSRLLAHELIRWLAPQPGLRWLEAGCGTGALTGTILAEALPVEVYAIDPTRAYIRHARKLLEDRQAQFILANAAQLPIENNSFDYIVSSLVLNFVPDPTAAVREMLRAVRPGGTIAAAVWDYAGEMQFLRRFWDMAVLLDPLAASQDEGRRFPMTNDEALAHLFRQAGLVGVEVKGIDIPTRFESFEDYWTPFLSGQGPAPVYVASLDPGQRSSLKEKLRQAVPIAPDGSVNLTARAWAARAIR